MHDVKPAVSAPLTDSYESLLEIGRAKGKAVRFVDPLGSSCLKASVEEMATSRDVLASRRLACESSTA